MIMVARKETARTLFEASKILSSFFNKATALIPATPAVQYRVKSPIEASPPMNAIQLFMSPWSRRKAKRAARRKKQTIIGAKSLKCPVEPC
jgi:hypothetical protein